MNSTPPDHNPIHSVNLYYSPKANHGTIPSTVLDTASTSPTMQSPVPSVRRTIQSSRPPTLKPQSVNASVHNSAIKLSKLHITPQRHTNPELSSPVAEHKLSKNRANDSDSDDAPQSHTPIKRSTIHTPPPPPPLPTDTPIASPSPPALDRPLTPYSHVKHISMRKQWSHSNLQRPSNPKKSPSNTQRRNSRNESGQSTPLHSSSHAHTREPSVSRSHKSSRRGSRRNKTARDSDESAPPRSLVADTTSTQHTDAAPSPTSTNRLRQALNCAASYSHRSSRLSNQFRHSIRRLAWDKAMNDALEVVNKDTAQPAKLVISGDQEQQGANEQMDSIHIAADGDGDTATGTVADDNIDEDNSVQASSAVTHGLRKSSTDTDLAALTQSLHHGEKHTDESDVTHHVAPDEDMDKQIIVNFYHENDTEEDEAESSYAGSMYPMSPMSPASDDRGIIDDTGTLDAYERALEAATDAAVKETENEIQQHIGDGGHAMYRGVECTAAPADVQISIPPPPLPIIMSSHCIASADDQHHKHSVSHNMIPIDMCSDDEAYQHEHETRARAYSLSVSQAESHISACSSASSIDPHVDSSLHKQPPWLYKWTSLRHRYLYVFSHRFKALPYICVGDIVFITACVSTVLGVLIPSFYTYINTFIGDDTHVYSTASANDRVNVAHTMGIVGTVVLALALLPISRNNFLSFLLNLPYDSLLVYHIGLICLSIVLVVLHGALATVNCFFNPPLYGPPGQSVVKQINDGVIGLYTSGYISTAAALIMMCISHPYIRRNVWELFIRTHRPLFIVTMVFAVIHWIWVIYIAALPLLLYIIDMAMRYYNQWGVKKHVTVYDVNVLGSDVIRIEFNIESFKYDCGQYVFICIPCIDPFEWHPFSLSSSPHMPTLTLHIRVQGNWTRKLYQYVQKLQQQHNTDATPIKYPRMYVDGPYGSTNIPLHEYTNFIFISGGIGITPLQSIYNTLIHEWKLGRRQLIHTSFVWTLKQRDNVEYLLTDGNAASECKQMEFNNRPCSTSISVSVQSVSNDKDTPSLSQCATSPSHTNAVEPDHENVIVVSSDDNLSDVLRIHMGTKPALIDAEKMDYDQHEHFGYNKEVADGAAEDLYRSRSMSVSSVANSEAQNDDLVYLPALGILPPFHSRQLLQDYENQFLHQQPSVDMPLITTSFHLTAQNSGSVLQVTRNRDGRVTSRAVTAAQAGNVNDNGKATMTPINSPTPLNNATDATQPRRRTPPPLPPTALSSPRSIDLHSHSHPLHITSATQIVSPTSTSHILSAAMFPQNDTTTAADHRNVTQVAYPMPPSLAAATSHFTQPPANSNTDTASWVQHDRPNLDEMFLKHVRLRGAARTVAVLCCGPRSMIREVERLCVKHSSSELQFHMHQESFEF